MADKKIPLSIVISAVDKATATIRSINEKVSRITSKITAPLREIGSRIGGLAVEAGLPKIVDGFRGIGSAVERVGGSLLRVGVIAAGAVGGLKLLVDGFDDMGDLAERVGVSVDFLAQMRFAAERSGASIQTLDGGLQTFAQNLGQLRAGTGKLIGFLQKVSPALLKQLKGAKDNESAFALLANAMAKIQDPAKRLALAQKAIGDGALAPLLARGATGIEELRQRYLQLAGSQETAASAAGKVDDSMKDLKAATDGIKAALVSGLGPALGIVVEKMQVFFTANRGRIAKWAQEIGSKLPAAISKFVSSVSNALGTAGTIIDKIGGFKVVALALAAAIVGPLVSSIYALGVAILTTPVGWIMAAIAAIAAGVFVIVKNWEPIKAFFVKLWGTIKNAFMTVYGPIIKGFLNFTPMGLLIKNWQPISEFFVSLWSGITSVFESAWGIIEKIMGKVSSAVDSVKGAIGTVTDALGSAADFINPFSDDDEPVRKQAISTLRGHNATSAKVTVDFANAPRGTRVAADPRNTATVDLSVGYQMGLSQ